MPQRIKKTGAVEVEKKRRLKPAKRKAQIIEATKELILENGLAWASVIRISQALDISQASLYYHFKNRREILLETFTSIVNETIHEIISSQQAENAEDFIRQSAMAFYERTIADPRKARLIGEFICASPTENLREEIAGIASGAIGIIEESIRQGIREGIFRDDLDVTLNAWKITALGFALNIGTLLQMLTFLTEEQALRTVDDILDGMKK